MLLLVGAVAAACGEDAPAMPVEWERVSAADVEFEVPAGWEPVPDDTDGFAAGMWTGPVMDDGTRLGISIDVACTEDPHDDAGAALDRWIEGPQWRDHEVLARSTAEVAGAASAARSVSRYVLRREATLEDAEVTQHAVLAVRDGVAALLLVQGVSDSLPTELAQRVRESVEFGAATPERVAACETSRAGSADGTDA